MAFSRNNARISIVCVNYYLEGAQFLRRVGGAFVAKSRPGRFGLAVAVFAQQEVRRFGYRDHSDRVDHGPHAAQHVEQYVSYERTERVRVQDTYDHEDLENRS